MIQNGSATKFGFKNFDHDRYDDDDEDDDDMMTQ
jgi:hypothetical protein